MRSGYAAIRKANVDDHDIAIPGLQGRSCVGQRGRAPRDLDAALVRERSREALQHDEVIIHDPDADHVRDSHWKRTRKPSSSNPRSSEPPTASARSRIESRPK